MPPPPPVCFYRPCGGKSRVVASFLSGTLLTQHGAERLLCEPPTSCFMSGMWYVIKVQAWASSQLRSYCSKTLEVVPSGCPAASSYVSDVRRHRDEMRSENFHGRVEAGWDMFIYPSRRWTQCYHDPDSVRDGYETEGRHAFFRHWLQIEGLCARASGPGRASGGSGVMPLEAAGVTALSCRLAGLCFHTG